MAASAVEVFAALMAATCADDAQARNATSLMETQSLPIFLLSMRLNPHLVIYSMLLYIDQENCFRLSVNNSLSKNCNSFLPTNACPISRDDCDV